MLILHWQSIVCFMNYILPAMQLALCGTDAAFMDLRDS